MIKCLRCQNTVDETRHAVCPVCLAPLAAPVAAPGQGMPVFPPPPGSGTPPARSVPTLPPPTPYAPPPGSPYLPPPAAAYTPPPGSPYPPPLPNALPMPNATPFPPYGQMPPIPGYAPPANTRTTLTGEVVETGAPLPGYGPSYAPGSYAPPPGTTPYGNPYPMPAPTRPQPAPAPTRSWNPLTWKLAGGGAFTTLYLAARLFAIVARNMHPATPVSSYAPMPPPSYSTGMGQSYSSRSSIPSFTPAPYRNRASTLPQAPTYMPPNMPTRPNFPSHFQPPNMPNVPTRPNFPSHFQPPNMPNMPNPPRGFSEPSSLPGRGSFGMPPGGRFGNP